MRRRVDCDDGRWSLSEPFLMMMSSGKSSWAHTEDCWKEEVKGGGRKARRLFRGRRQGVSNDQSGEVSSAAGEGKG